MHQHDKKTFHMFVDLVIIFKIIHEKKKKLGCNKVSEPSTSQMARMRQKMQPQMKKKSRLIRKKKGGEGKGDAE